MASSGPTTVEEYMATIPEQARAALEALRQTIKAVVPEATERFAYRIPIVRYQGDLVGFSAHKNHYSLHVMSSTLLQAYPDELEGYRKTKGTVHFEYGQPLPVELVTKLVKARMAENEGRSRK